MNEVGEKRIAAAAEIKRLRTRIDGEPGRSASGARWGRPLAAALGGLAIAWVVRRLIGGPRGG